MPEVAGVAPRLRKRTSRLPQSRRELARPAGGLSTRLGSAAPADAEVEAAAAVFELGEAAQAARAEEQVPRVFVGKVSMISIARKCALKCPGSLCFCADFRVHRIETLPGSRHDAVAERPLCQRSGRDHYRGRPGGARELDNVRTGTTTPKRSLMRLTTRTLGSPR